MGFFELLRGCPSVSLSSSSAASGVFKRQVCVVGVCVCVCCRCVCVCVLSVCVCVWCVSVCGVGVGVCVWLGVVFVRVLIGWVCFVVVLLFDAFATSRYRLRI